MRLQPAPVIAIALLILACAQRLDSPAIETALVTREAQLAAGKAFETLFANYARVLAISERLRLSNVELCGNDVGGYLGWLVFVDRDFGSQEMRALAEKVVNVGQTPVVVALTPNGPAANAGVTIGDEVVSIGGKRARTHLQAARAEQRLTTEHAQIRIRRGDQEREIEVAPLRACRYEAMPYGVEGMEAWPTRDGNVAVTIALVEAASDDELAFSLAHAFALQQLGVRAQDPGEPLPEPATTDMAVEMCARAGFDVGGVARLLELQAVEQPWLVFAIPRRFVGLQWVEKGPVRVGELPRRIVALRAAIARRAEAKSLR